MGRTEQNQPDENRLLTTDEAAAFLSLTERTLTNWRNENAGPPYLHIGTGRRKSVRYRYGDLLAYIRNLPRTTPPPNTPPEAVTP